MKVLGALMGWALTLTAVVAIGVLLIPSAMGLERYVLVGGSMEPTIHKGSVIFDEKVPTKTLTKGDVITYTPPSVDKPVTHRIIGIKQTKEGRVYTIKGDANKATDPGPVTFPNKTQAKFKYAVPYLGYLFIGLGNPTHRLFILGLPALIIAFSYFVRLWRDASKAQSLNRKVSS